MKLIINNETNAVIIQTNAEITEANNVYLLDGVSTGISILDNSIVSNPNNFPYFVFIANTYSYVDGVWSIYDEEIYNETVNQYNSQQKELRLKAYEQESDPIFFKWQRGEATQQEWLDKIAEIKARLPYQE